MDGQRQVFVYYNFDESRSRIKMEYDPLQNKLIIRGNRNSFSELANICSIYARADDSLKHEGWGIGADQNDLPPIKVIFNRDAEKV